MTTIFGSLPLIILIRYFNMYNHSYYIIIIVIESISHRSGLVLIAYLSIYDILKELIYTQKQPSLLNFYGSMSNNVGDNLNQ